MRLLKNLCVIVCLLCIAAALTGIGAISAGSSGATVARLDAFGRILTLVSAFVFAAFAYGIHRKAPMTWPAGFVLIVLGYIGFASVPLLTLGVPHGGDIATALTALFGGAVAIFWGSWWKRQRSYFH